MMSRAWSSTKSLTKAAVMLPVNAVMAPVNAVSGPSQAVPAAGGKIQNESFEGRVISSRPSSPRNLKKQLSSFQARMEEDKSGTIDIATKYCAFAPTHATAAPRSRARAACTPELYAFESHAVSDTDYVASLPSQEGKVVAITGTSSGTGFMLARTLVEKKAKVYCLNRPSGRVALAMNKLATSAAARGAPMPVAIDCDLASFAATRAGAAALLSACADTGLDVLCNNAGIMAFNDDATEDGCDVQMQTNHLSHFLLTKLCMPALEKAAAQRGEARVVNHTSALRAAPIKGWDNKLQREYLGRNGGKLGGNGSGMLSGPNYERCTPSPTESRTLRTRCLCCTHAALS